MLMPVSADFITLCRWQLSLLAQGFNVERSTVYLAEDWQESGSTALRPIICYPEVADPNGFGRGEILRLEPTTTSAEFPSLTSELPEDLEKQDIRTDFLPALTPRPAQNSLTPWVMPPPAPDSRQIVLPLIHEKLVLGLLTVRRPAPDWNDWEQAQIQKIAHTLAISCFLDQQNQWLLQQQTPPQELALGDQRETLDNLLHQLKSPITAIRTFGKLILKRLKPQDDRRAVDGILQETDHVQELLQEVHQVLKDADTSSKQLSGIAKSAIDHGRALSGDGLNGDGLNGDDLSHTLPNAGNLPPSQDLKLLPGKDPALFLPASSCLLPPATFLSSLTLDVCSVEDVIARPLETATALAQERDLRMQIEIAPSLPLIVADARALREVVTNIVDNALKYTPAGGEISILVFCDRKGQYAPDSPEAGVAIAVSDTGTGIPLADQTRLFERHYRGEKAQGMIPGTGLGLAIARELMIKMHGNVCYWSPRCPALVAPGFDDAQSVGSTFLIWIPIASHPPFPERQE